MRLSAGDQCRSWISWLYCKVDLKMFSSWQLNQMMKFNHVYAIVYVTDDNVTKFVSIDESIKHCWNLAMVSWHSRLDSCDKSKSLIKQKTAKKNNIKQESVDYTTATTTSLCPRHIWRNTSEDKGKSTMFSAIVDFLQLHVELHWKIRRNSTEIMRVDTNW